MELDIDVAVEELIASASTSQKLELAQSAGYAESGPTYDPAGNYLCGGCSFRLLPDKCAVVKGKISMTTGGCIIYHHGAPAYDKPLPHQFPQDQVIYTERPNVKGFGCKRCKYGKDGGVKRPLCIQWDFYVDPNACCFANEGKDDIVAPDLKAYGTSEGVRKAWDTRGRGRKAADTSAVIKNPKWSQFKDGQPIKVVAYHATYDEPQFGKRGIFFSPEPAVDYGDKIYRTELDMKNPVTVNGDQMDAAKKLGFSPEEYSTGEKMLEDQSMGRIDPGDYYTYMDRKIAQKAQEKGYDAVVYNSLDMGSLSRMEFQVFDRAVLARMSHIGGWDDYVKKYPDEMTNVERLHEELNQKIKNKLEAYGTSEGVTKAWDTRGRGQKDYHTESGVHVGIFDRPEEAGGNAVSVTNYFGSDAPPSAERIKIAEEFEKAVKEREAQIPISMLVPLQKTVVKEKLQRAAENLNPKPVSVFHYNGKHYLVDGHHRVAGESALGHKNVDAIVYHLSDRVAAAFDWTNGDYISAQAKMDEIRSIAENELNAYGTSEGVTKAWDTRGRGRKQQEEMWQYPLYRGTTTQRLDEILKEGLVPAKNPMKLDTTTEQMLSQKGHVYATYQEDIAKKYAFIKQNYAEANPGDQIAGVGFELRKPKDGPPAVTGTKPVVVSVRVPVSLMKQMKEDPDSEESSDAYMFQGTIPRKYLDKVEVYDDNTWKQVDLKTGKIAAEEDDDSVPLYFVLDDIKKLAGGDLHAEALYHGVEIIGFSKPQEEVIRATASRVPQELMFNVVRIVSAPELGAKHGRFEPDTKTVYINPHEFDLRQRFGEGQGWIHHMELTMVHEFMHSIYAFLPELMKDQWRQLSGWMIGSKDGQAPAYVEKRPGWEVGKVSKWTHKKGIKFPRHYSERNDDEDFADCATYVLLGKAHMVDEKKKDFIAKLFQTLVKKYPRFSVESPDRAYGERELAYRNMQAGTGWHGVDLDGTLAEWHGFKSETHIGKPIPKMLARVKKWLDNGEKVKIMTARVSRKESAAIKKAIEKWCMKYLGQKLEVTNEKDMYMIDIWDDRARRVEENTGKVIR